jgi:pyruvate-formate lyase-activating enzyme
MTERPAMIQIESSTFCNGSCVFCPHKDMKRQGGMMHNFLFERILDEIRHWGSMEVLLFLNGEPLLFPFLFHWLQRLREESHKTVIFTNASLLDEEKSERLIAFDDVIRTMVFSLNGVNKETLAAISGLDFDTTYSNVAHFVEMNKGKIPIEAHIPNFSGSRAFLDKWHELWGNVLGQETPIGATSMANWAGNIHDEFELKVTDRLEKQYCGRLGHLVVLWNGDVVLCCMDHEGRVMAGNLYNSTIEEVYNGEVLSKYRQYHTLGKFNELELCSECNLLIAERKEIGTR